MPITQDETTTFTPLEDEHFEIYKLYGLYHWESMGMFSDEHCSEDGFETPDAARADAVDRLIEVYDEEFADD